MRKYTGREFASDFEAVHTVAEEVATDIEKFRVEHDLPVEWFGEPDHLAIKCAGRDHYREVMAQVRNFSLRQTELPLNGRMLGTSELDHPLTFGHYGEINWLEIMEPRPERAGQDVVGIDHAEFYFADFAAARAILGQRAIVYSDESNPSHAWISFQTGEVGIEVKLNDGRLAEVVEDELASGESSVVWERSEQ